jgi:hypothetical protein
MCLLIFVYPQMGMIFYPDCLFGNLNWILLEVTSLSEFLSKFMKNFTFNFHFGILLFLEVGQSSCFLMFEIDLWKDLHLLVVHYFFISEFSLGLEYQKKYLLLCQLRFVILKKYRYFRILRMNDAFKQLKIIQSP